MPARRFHFPGVPAEEVPMTQVVTLTLDQLNCIAEEDNPSSPYLWTAFLWIDETDHVQLRTPVESDDRLLLSSNLQPGQSASIPPSVGVATYSADNLGQAFIQVTALWQAHDFSANALQDGFKKFGTSLQSAIQDNLLGLASSDPQTQQHATDEVEKTVHQAVYDAIWNGLTAVEKAMIGDGQIKLDSEIGTAYQVFRTIQPKQQFTITLGDLYRGRLLFYRDETQNGSGLVAGPSVIGASGWGEFRFLFSGGDGIIYAVNREGDLLFYRDHNQDGTGNVADPSVIGHGGWGEFKFLFSGGSGIIYAVKGGDLLFYRDHNQDGTGNVADPSVIGHGGWDALEFVFSGGNGIIYAVKGGKLLFYRDHTQDGTGNVADPSVIGDGAWGEFKFLFSAGDGIIYAVDHAGDLLFYRDHNQDGTGNVANPSVIGAGWDEFKFVFSGGGKGIIYAAEQNPTHGYQIPGILQVTSS
jgi:hypothetical protein